MRNTIHMDLLFLYSYTIHKTDGCQSILDTMEFAQRRKFAEMNNFAVERRHFDADPTYIIHFGVDFLVSQISYCHFFSKPTPDAIVCYHFDKKSLMFYHCLNM